MAPKPPFDPYADVGQAQKLSMDAVTGYGEALRPQLLREIGNTLGGLNEIGALRSGGTTQALTDISSAYGQQIGAYAKMASGNALGYGLEAGRLRLAERQRQDQKKAGLLKAIGGVLGAGIGFVASGLNPAGAVAGAGIGSGMVGNTQPGYENLS